MKVAINTRQGLGKSAETKSSYVEALWAMGLEPVQICPEDSIETIRMKCYDINGLILMGGPDIPPEFYGGICHSTIKPQEASKIDHDFKLIHFAIDNNIPLLGICAGMQTLACYFGGKMFPHIPDGGPRINHQTEIGRHRLTGVDHRMAKTMGTDNPLVNTRHHQCVSDPGELKIGAFSPDGFIEGVYHKSLPIVGVQWHPEDLILESTSSSHLFRSLVGSF